LEAGVGCHDHLDEVSGRLTSNLRVRLGDGFDVLREVRPSIVGGLWARETRVYRDGELRATFAVSYDYAISPHDFEVSCLLPAHATAIPKLPALAASLLLAGGVAAVGGALAGALAGGSLMLAATMAGRVRVSGRRPRRSQEDGMAGIGDALSFETLCG
jgi:hypothetical protein